MSDKLEAINIIFKIENDLGVLVSDGCIRDLEFNSYLHQKPISILI